MFIRIASLVLASVFSTIVRGEDLPQLETVKNFDVVSYMGTWHQIATIPAWFQRRCVEDTSATYTLGLEGMVDVANRCTEEDGEVQTANGQARVNRDFNSPSKLEVTFVNLLGSWLWFTAGDYWIIDLTPEYSIAVVADRKREYLWILARNDNLPEETLIKYETLIRAKGFDTCKIIISQEGNLNGKTLCSMTASRP